VLLLCHRTCSVVMGIVDGEHLMELLPVRYFLAVASTLNFTRAAEMCNVTRPALTKGVKKLEQELGGQLIYRERQLAQLTDLGSTNYRSRAIHFCFARS
jgi:Bacterial regulatory helix-turn-helix protein, lysR family